MSTLTTNAQVGAAIPQNLAEIALVAVEMVMTVTIFNYVLGEITNVIMAQDAALVATRAQARRALPYPDRVPYPTLSRPAFERTQRAGALPAARRRCAAVAGACMSSGARLPLFGACAR